MGNRAITFGGVIGLLLALQGCEGGQTGQPSRGEIECQEGETRMDFGCCRPAALDERIGQLSAEEILSEHASVIDVPLFWSDIPASGADVFALEPEQARETRLSLLIALDESAPILFCNQSTFEIPVSVTLSTEDGFTTDFSATLGSVVDGSPPPNFELQPSAADFPIANASSEIMATCSPQLHFGPDGLVGRFCDAERGIALFPTACSGIAQLPPGEAPYPPLTAPSDAFVPFDGVTLSYENLPPITLSGRIEDPNACYQDRQTFWIAADFSFETGGVRFATDQVLGYGGPTLERDPTLQPGNPQLLLPPVRIQFTERCVDVSGSVEWQEVAEASGRTTELCLAPVLIQLEDGRVQYLAEAILDGSPSIGWVFQGP